MSRPALGPIQWVRGFPGGKAAGGVILAIHFHIAPRLRSSGAVLLLPLCVFMLTGHLNFLSFRRYRSALRNCLMCDCGAEKRNLLDRLE
jgi:hypothetical protein